MGESGIQHFPNRECGEDVWHTADMVGVGVGGNEQVNVVCAEFFKIAYHPLTHVHIAGVDQDHRVAEENERRVPLPDIEKIHPEVAAVRSLMGGAARQPGKVCTAGGEDTGNKDKDSTGRQDCLYGYG
jgi:hypothetical protein